MNSLHTPLFKLSVLSLALVTGFAYAADETVAEQMQAQELQNITVRATGDTSSRRITVNKLNETTDTRLKEVLFNEPSIDFGGGNGTSSFMYLRGMGQNSVDIKVDNAYNDSQFLYHQSRNILDPSMVKIVSVQKGAGSASAGIGQTNGAIVAKTLDAADLLKNSSNPNFGAKISVGYNSNDSLNYGLSLFGKAGVWDFLLVGNRVEDEAYKGGKGYKNEYDGSKRVPYSALDKTSYLAKIGATFDNHRFVLSHLNELEEGNRLVREEFLTTPRGSKIANGRLAIDRQAPAYRKMRVANTNLEWNATDLGFAKSATANVYRMVQSRWSEDDSGNGYAGNIKGATTTRIITVGANVNFDSQIHDRVLLKYGVNYRYQTIKPELLANGFQKQAKTDYGLYTEAISTLTDKLTLTTGLRYDHFSFTAMDGKKRSDGNINPSANLIYQFTPEFSVHAMHNYATRSPRMNDAIRSTGFAKSGIVSIRDDVKAERARNTEIGFEWNHAGFNVEGSYFWQNIKDGLGTIARRNAHNVEWDAIINVGTIKNKGYELAVAYRNGGWKTRLAVSQAKPRFYGKGFAPNGEYATAIGRTWTASLAYRFNNPDLELGIQHRQLQGVSVEDNFFIVGDSTIPQPKNGKSGYGVTDVTLNWKPFKNDKMNVNFAIYNVANRLYIPHAQRSSFPGEGRQFRVGMNYTF